MGAGRSWAEGLPLLCSGGGCLVQAPLPEGSSIWEKDLMIFPFIFIFSKSSLEKSLKLHEGGFCWVTPAVCCRVLVSFEGDTVLGGVEEEQCLG